MSASAGRAREGGGDVGAAGPGGRPRCRPRTRATQLAAEVRGRSRLARPRTWRDQYAVVLGTGDPVLDEPADVVDRLA
ncbi:MAG: hypothetical protein JOY78_06370 [Pseudonocardia sp.]|nr:hypothetical protein [Pseudonocardia sp.]